VGPLPPAAVNRGLSGDPRRGDLYAYAGRDGDDQPRGIAHRDERFVMSDRAPHIQVMTRYSRQGRTVTPIMRSISA
jgi:hypothetical protein